MEGATGLVGGKTLSVESTLKVLEDKDSSIRDKSQKHMRRIERSGSKEPPSLAGRHITKKGRVSGKTPDSRANGDQKKEKPKSWVAGNTSKTRVQRETFLRSNKSASANDIGKMKKYEHVFKEIIKTENTFCDQMILVTIKIFQWNQPKKKPLQLSLAGYMLKKGVILEEHYQVLQSLELLAFDIKLNSKSLLFKLKKTGLDIRNELPVIIDSEEMKSYLDAMKNYITFYQAFGDVFDKISKLKAYQKHSGRILQEFKVKTKNTLDLDALFITPIQRGPRWEMMIKDLASKMDDSSALKKCVEKMERELSTVGSSTRKLSSEQIDCILRIGGRADVDLLEDSCVLEELIKSEKNRVKRTQLNFLKDWKESQKAYGKLSIEQVRQKYSSYFRGDSLRINGLQTGMRSKNPLLKEKNQDAEVEGWVQRGRAISITSRENYCKKKGKFTISCKSFIEAKREKSVFPVLIDYIEFSGRKKYLKALGELKSLELLIADKTQAARIISKLDVIRLMYLEEDALLFILDLSTREAYKMFAESLIIKVRKAREGTQQELKRFIEKVRESIIDYIDQKIIPEIYKK